ncbi:unnamed protein product [Adineta ricciae]|uniref:Uncharacterized protein n=1 Tax=Adineta ricciae TaxID=249248 RepID=A0A815LWE9_ADIRI|nr:unnamed protein product [Adineta ricciae]CAF1415377.1 unnamed protein product [Adineta ricciae]
MHSISLIVLLLLVFSCALFVVTVEAAFDEAYYYRCVAGCRRMPLPQARAICYAACMAKATGNEIMNTRIVSNNIKLRLHYWNIRGRVQAVRYMLEDIAHKHENVDYKETFEPINTMMNTWAKRKSDQTVSGPFRTLPVLHWNDSHTFSQSLTIGQLLAKKFDLYGQLTSKVNDQQFLETYINGVVSCAYTDIISNLITCIWSMVNFVDETNPSNRLTRKIPNDLKALNDLLEKSSTSFYYDQHQPTIADYFVFEAFTMARDYSKRFLPNEENYQSLIKLEHVMKQRPAIANYFKQNLLSKRFTGSPKETEYLINLTTPLN